MKELLVPYFRQQKSASVEGNGRRHQRIKKTKGHADAERNSRAKFADELRDAREKLWNDAQCEGFQCEWQSGVD